MTELLEAIRTALYPTTSDKTLSRELTINVIGDGASGAETLSDAVVDACRKVAHRGL